MKIGDDVVCVDISEKYGSIYLTLGSIYKIIDYSESYYTESKYSISVLNDLNRITPYDSSRFIPLGEYRSIIINQILNNE